MRGAEELDDVLSAGLHDQQSYSEKAFELEDANRPEDAIRVLQRGRQLFPAAARHFDLREALMLPVCYATEGDIDRYSQRFSAGLRRLARNLALDSPEDRRDALDAISRHVNFYLGYQGRNVRDLQEEYGRFVHRIAAANYPEWVRPLAMPPAPAGGRIRIGYVSAHFRNHSVAKLFLGWIRERDRRDFDVFIYHNGHTVDAVTERARRSADHFRHIPGELEPLCDTVLRDQLHIVVYLDVRHRRMAVMSSLRLAPVQCVAWAHPITSGSPSIDYFLTSDLMEPPDAHDHYTERLVRLPGIGVCYPKPLVPHGLLTRKREDFGLREDSIVFLCCQALFKYLPQHDRLFVQIARQVPSSQFAFLGLNEALTGDFLARLVNAFAAEGLDARDHCIILPRLGTMAYLNLNLLSDVFLDSVEWSGGVTTLEAIACGLPVVTLPGKFMRGRHSAAILNQLGATETIARDEDSYVQIAVKLGLDRAWRAQVLETMAAGHARLYSDRTCVVALEEFFRSVVRERTLTQA